MGMGVKKNRGANLGCKGIMIVESSSVHHIGHDLTLVYAHMLPEVIVTAKVLSTSFDGTLVRCDGVTKS